MGVANDLAVGDYIGQDALRRKGVREDRVRQALGLYGTREGRFQNRTRGAQRRIAVENRQYETLPIELDFSFEYPVFEEWLDLHLLRGSSGLVWTSLRDQAVVCGPDE